MNQAHKCFETYIKDEYLPEDMEEYLLEEYSTIAYSLKGKSITDEEAFDILGEDVFCEGVERAIMHCDAVCESDDGREVFMEQK